MRSPQDVLSITATDGSSFNRWTSFELINSMVRSCEASFEVGDDGSWRDLSELSAIGADFQVLLNGKPRMSGKVEILNSGLSPEQSSTVRFVVRTVLADLEVDSAEISIRTKGRSLGEVVRATLSYAGIDESRVVYRGELARDLMTGKRTKGGAEPKDIEVLKEEAAGVQPGEKVKAFLDRHLRRHGFLIFDGPDGKLVVAEPDDDQEESYFFRCLRNDGRFNNCRILDKTKDATGAPTETVVYGFGGGRDFQHTKLIGISENALLLDGGFRRREVIVDDGVKTKELASRTAARAMSERLRRQDCFSILTDGLSYRERANILIPYAPDTTCAVLADTIGGAQGKYYVETTQLRANANDGCQAQLQVVKAGTWTL